MDVVRFVLLALLVVYIVGLLVNLMGLNRLREPARYHLGALAIYLVVVGAGGYLLSDAGAPDFARAAQWMLGPVALWWAHQLWSHRDRPDPHARPKPPGWVPPAV